MDFKKETMVKFKQILENLGFVVYTPDNFYIGNHSGDGEALCATFCLPKNNICVAAMTKDYDALLYGSRYILTDIESEKIKEKILQNNVERTIEKTIHKALLKDKNIIMDKMNINETQFQIGSILGGIDYNTNLPGIAFATAIKKIIKIQNIEYVAFMIQIYQLYIYVYNNVGDIEFPIDYILNETKQSIEMFNEICLFFNINEYDPQNIKILVNSIFEYISKIDNIKFLLDTSINFFSVYPIILSDNMKLPENIKLELDINLFRENSLKIFEEENLKGLYKLFTDLQYIRDKLTN